MKDRLDEGPPAKDREVVVSVDVLKLIKKFLNRKKRKPIMNLLTDKKTNKSAVVFIFATLVLPIIVKILEASGYPEWAEIVRDAIEVLQYLSAGTGTVGLIDKARRGEPIIRGEKK